MSSWNQRSNTYTYTHNKMNKIEKGEKCVTKQIHFVKQRERACSRKFIDMKIWNCSVLRSLSPSVSDCFFYSCLIFLGQATPHWIDQLNVYAHSDAQCEHTWWDVGSTATVAIALSKMWKKIQSKTMCKCTYFYICLFVCLYVFFLLFCCSSNRIFKCI